MCIYIYIYILYTRNDFFKNCNLKKGIGIEREKESKHVRDQIVWKQIEDAAQGFATELK